MRDRINTAPAAFDLREQIITMLNDRMIEGRCPMKFLKDNAHYDMVIKECRSAVADVVL